MENERSGSVGGAVEVTERAWGRRGGGVGVGGGVLRGW